MHAFPQLLLVDGDNALMGVFRHGSPSFGLLIDSLVARYDSAKNKTKPKNTTMTSTKNWHFSKVQTHPSSAYVLITRKGVRLNHQAKDNQCAASIYFEKKKIIPSH